MVRTDLDPMARDSRLSGEGRYWTDDVLLSMVGLGFGGVVGVVWACRGRGLICCEVVLSGSAVIVEEATVGLVMAGKRIRSDMSEALCVLASAVRGIAVWGIGMSFVSLVSTDRDAASRGAGDVAVSCGVNICGTVREGNDDPCGDVSPGGRASFSEVMAPGSVRIFAWEVGTGKVSVSVSGLGSWLPVTRRSTMSSTIPARPAISNTFGMGNAPRKGRLFRNRAAFVRAPRF